MKQTLYEMSQNFNNLMELCLDETVDLDTVEAALKSVEGDVQQKCFDGIGLIKSLEALKEESVKESRRLAERAHAIANRIDAIKRVYMDGLKAMGKTHVDTGRGRMTIQKNPPALIVSKLLDVKTLPDEYKKHIPESWEVNKAAVKTALKNGENVPGCALVQGESLRIR
jgi:hypothetical protein